MDTAEHIHAMLADVAKDIYIRYGILVEKVEFAWLDLRGSKEHRAGLLNTMVQTRIRHENAADIANSK